LHETSAGVAEEVVMKGSSGGAWTWVVAAVALAAALAVSVFGCRAPQADADSAPAGVPRRGDSSYLPTIEPPFDKVFAELSRDKPLVMQRALALLRDRYELVDRPVRGVTMTRGKPVQGGVRVKLPRGVTWQQLAELSPAEIKRRGLWPAGFLPLPHPDQAQGGMVFPDFEIREIRRQEDRDLARFDVDFDLPDHFLPEFPPPLFLTTRPDLGDVSQGELITSQNFYRLFNGILNPKDLEGLRLLVAPFMQQQFNVTADRRSAKPSRGVACLDCHANGHTNAGFHLTGDIRPQAYRRRIDTPTLRGVNQQRLFGSQRALHTVEDFTEFEQRGAYFDGDVVIAVKKGVNVLERGSQVHAMAEFQALIGFPPAPRLDLAQRLDRSKATASELRGEQLFLGKARCAECHPAPIFSDNLSHDLDTERFYEPMLANGRYEAAGGPTKTFPLRGIKDSPPYLHDGRLLTLDDVVEFFNLVLGTRLSEDDKRDLLAYLYCL
jgi:cytochrome c peroxidase